MLMKPSQTYANEHILLLPARKKKTMKTKEAKKLLNKAE